MLDCRLRCATTTARTLALFSSQFRGLMSGQSLFQTHGILNFRLLRRVLVASFVLTVSRSLVIVGENALGMLLSNLVWDTLHSEYLDIEAGAVRKGIVDRSQVLLMDLTHMDAETCDVSEADR